MRAFTGQASLALQNARLFEETEPAFKEFAALYEISNALSADNDLNTLLKDIVEHAPALLGAVTGAMYLYNQKMKVWRLWYQQRPSYPSARPCTLAKGVARRSLKLIDP